MMNNFLTDFIKRRKDHRAKAIADKIDKTRSIEIGTIGDDHIPGTKIIGRYGNKGVVVSVPPEANMPDTREWPVFIPDFKQFALARLMYEWRSIKKSKNNSRRQRRILRRAARAFGDNSLKIFRNRFTDQIIYMHMDHREVWRSVKEISEWKENNNI